MISLMLALMAPMAAPLPAPQAVSATLQSCDMENGRWVCRYAVPDIEIVPLPGNDVVADAPAVVLGEAPTPGGPVTTRAVPATPVERAATPVPTAVETPAPVDAGILTERETRLVARCADAGWMSLCLPDDRRAARALRDKEATFLSVRATVTGRLAEDDCDGAVKAALDGGYLALAQQTRDFCAAN